MLSQIQSIQERSNAPPEWKKLSGVEKVIAGAIATRCGGDSTAASHCTAPGYESPKLPTLPSDQGWAAAHSIVS